MLMLLAQPIQAQQVMIEIDKESFIGGCRIGIFRFAQAVGVTISKEYYEVKLYQDCERQYEYVNMELNGRSKSI